MNNTDYKYCIGAGAPLCSQCKRHRPYSQPNTPEQKEWTLVTLDPTTGFCQMCDPKGGEWIDVKYALPTIGERVLAIVDGPTRKSVIIAKRISHDTTNPTNPKWHWTQVTKDTEITHWQPLPPIETHMA